MPWQLVMSTHLAGLFFLPLWVVCLVCRYFKFVVKCMAFKMSVYSTSFIFFNILHPPSLFTWYTCLCFVVDIVHKSRLQYKGALKYLEESVTGMKIRLRKRQQGSVVAIGTGDSGGNAGRCTDELWHFLWACTVVFPQKSKADDCDIIRWCHSDHSCYLREGNI